jgi:superfamily II DNA or RNA helicase
MIELDLFAPPPEVVKVEPHKILGRIPLRWCQREDVDAMIGAIEQGYKHPCCVGATGYGKGAMIAEMVGRMMPAGKVLCLIDRAHLVHQLAEEIERHLGITVGRVADGECFSLHSDVVVATVQAMYTPDRSGKPLYEYSQFKGVKAVIADEAHKFFADVFRSVLTYFVDKGAVVPLFTATPVAANGARWSSFVDWTPKVEGPCMRTTGWCIRNGYLVAPKQAFVRVDLDLSQIHARLTEPDEEHEDDGDELANLLIDLLRETTERKAASFAAGVAEIIGDRRAIVFAPARVAAAKLLASWLSGRMTCEAVWGARVDKTDVLDRAKAGNPQTITNVNLLCEGYNDPFVSAVFMCRLLDSWRLIQQMAGRALRPHPSIVGQLSRLDAPDAAEARRRVIAESQKPDALIADLVGLDGKIVQASAIEVLYADEPEDVKNELARRVMRRPRKDAGEPPPSEELEAARETVRQRQGEHLAEMARRRAMAGDIPANVSVSFDGGSPTMPSVPTPKQTATLGEKARFVAFALQYDADRARDIAERTPRHVLRGMTASCQKKLGDKKPDWYRARRAYPQWANQR